MPPKKKPKEPVTQEKQLIELLSTVTEEQILAAHYRNSFYEFFKAAFTQVLEPDTEFHDTPIIKELCDLLQVEAERIGKGIKRTKHLLINLPPRLLKSKIISVTYNAWCWTKLPHFKFLTASVTDDLRTALSNETRTLLESDWYKRIFPEVRLKDDQNQKTHYITSAGGERKAFSVGSASIGFGAHIILLDDIQQDTDQYSDATKNQAERFYEGKIKSRLNNKKTGLIVVVMQRLFKDDFTDYLLNTYGEETFNHISVPLEVTEESVVKPERFKDYYDSDGLLLPDLYDREVINDLKKQPATYAAQYLQAPIPADAGIFKAESFNKISWLEFNQKYGGKRIIWHFFLDTAYGDTKSSDATAMVVACFLDNQIFIKDVVEKRLNFPDLIKFLKQYVPQHYSPESRIYVEKAASGISLLQQLRAETLFNISELSHGRENKVVRAQAVANFVDSKRVSLIEGTYIQPFLNQVTVFPHVKNDDQTDAFVYCVKTLSNSTSGFFFATV
ncbi:hypothetical protein EFA69_06415 [Rufibacter immobilis]|uniref:Terminase large subunit gp17-like C-terminal domain-containing protein n=1 Tax=Rufibacter immobilis TaxID=1348778 RepID=A0A3M9MZJ0_9BACT|nr:hypothetical protein [Rufibacter immobilis]RNI30920.1 hypothetical protein EFA69_06415 [Rufibacter immobilis]